MSKLLEPYGITPESRVSLLGIRDSAFLAAVLPQVLNPSQHRAAYQSDFIFLAVESHQQLKRLAPLRKYLNPGGSFWLIYPNSMDALLLQHLSAASLQATQILNFSPTHNALQASP